MWLEEGGRILVCIPGFLVSGLGDQVGDRYVSQDKEHEKRAVSSVLDWVPGDSKHVKYILKSGS